MSPDKFHFMSLIQLAGSEVKCESRHVAKVLKKIMINFLSKVTSDINLAKVGRVHLPP